MDLIIEMVGAHREAAIPQRTAWKDLAPLPADLPIETTVWFKEAQVTQRAVEEHFAIGPDLGRGNHGGEHAGELLVEVLLDEIGHRAIERDAAAEQEHRDPARRDEHHAPRKAALHPRGVWLLAQGWRGRNAAFAKLLARLRGRRGCIQVHGSL